MSARHCHVGDFQEFVALGPPQPLQDLFAGHQLFTCAAAIMDTEVSEEQNKRMQNKGTTNGITRHQWNCVACAVKWFCHVLICLVYLVLELRRTGWEAAVQDWKAKGWQKDEKAKPTHFCQKPWFCMTWGRRRGWTKAKVHHMSLETCWDLDGIVICWDYAEYLLPRDLAYFEPVTICFQHHFKMRRSLGR